MSVLNQVIPLKYKVIVAEKYRDSKKGLIDSYHPIVLTYDFFYLLFACIYFQTTHKAPFKLLHHRIRKLYIRTNGLTDNIISFLLAYLFKPKYNLQDMNGILGNLTKEKIKAIKKNIKKNGYYVFENKLDDTICDKIKEFAFQSPCYTDIPSQGILPNYDPNIPVANRYSVIQKAMFENELIQKIYTDRSIIGLAQEYLGSRPILFESVIWLSTWKHWSEGFNGAAQLFHQDSDGIKWIKFFIYLDDVDMESGPHCLVEGSNKNTPSLFWPTAEGRFSDTDVEKYYGADKIKKITGKKGTILVVDTHALHKGTPPTKKDRYVLELEYLNMHFDKCHLESPIIQINDKFSSTTVDFIKKHRTTFPEYNYLIS
jgi:hypothetical protein